MAYQRWSWLPESSAGGELLFEAEGFLPTPATAVFGEGGYPALFTVTSSLGFFATGPGEGLLYNFDKDRDTAFLFPNPAG